MKRSFDELGRSRFDLLVIGGGIYGAWVAFDAALRGLKVALVEKTDWAAGTSSNSSKLIHGGLRYLAQGHFGIVRKALRERRRLSRLAPHRIRPLRFVVPLYSGSPLGGWRLRVGLWLYDRLAGSGQPVGSHEALDRGAMLKRYHFLHRQGLQRGFTYGDCQTDDARLVLEIVDGAATAGAVAVNHATVTGLVEDGGSVRGGLVRDGETGETLEVRAALTADCRGAWSPRVSGESRPVARRITKGIHLVVPKLPTDEALLLIDDAGGRVVFLIPWYGRTLIGTTDTDYAGSPDRVTVEPEEIRYLLRQVNRAIDPGWRESEVIASCAGLRVLPGDRNGSPSSQAREFRLEEPRTGLFVPVGGKLSSARVDAAGLVSRVMHRLRRRGECTTGERPFPWSEIDRPAAGEPARRSVSPALDAETAALGRARYGNRLEQVHAIIAESPDLARRIVPDLPFCRAEIVHAIRDEMARSLDDLLRRRIPLALLSRLDEPIVADVANLAGRHLDWSSTRRHQEIDRCLATRSTIPVAVP